MKISRKIQLFLFAGFAALLSLASCQQDENPQTTVDPETLSVASPLTTLLEQVAMSDTATDNAIDSTSCFQVKMPYEIVVNGQWVAINSEADLDTATSYYGGTVTGDNVVEYVFPITLIFPDYSETVVNNQQEYDALLADCEGTTVPVNNPIACISIVYPIDFFVYNADFQVAETIAINNNQQLFSFLANLTPVQYFAISYPFSIIGASGETLAITNNAECLAVILAAIPICEETAVNPIEDCEVTNTPFSQIFNTALGLPDVMEGTVWSAETHEYTFSVSTDGTICSIGYQADQGFPDVEYIMSICDNEGNVLYSGTHTFSDVSTSYALINPIEVQANVQYTIKRVRPGGGGLCRVASRVTGDEPILPLTADSVTIHHSRYYGGGTGSDSPNQYLIPYIDFSFTPNN